MLILGAYRSMRIPYKIDNTYGRLLFVLDFNDRANTPKVSSKTCSSSTCIAAVYLTWELMLPQQPCQPLCFHEDTAATPERDGEESGK